MTFDNQTIGFLLFYLVGALLLIAGILFYIIVKNEMKEENRRHKHRNYAK